MKKSLFIIAILSLLHSCTIPYDLETRYIIETKLVDFNGNPISNEKLEVYVNTEFNGETISSSFSDENGFTRIVFPKPDLTNFSFNISTNNNSSTGYLSKQINNIKPENFEDYKLVFNHITLVKHEDISNLNIELNRINQNKELRKIEIIGQVYNQFEYFNPIINPENYYPLPTYFLLIKNQDFVLKYAVYNYTTMLLEENIVNLSIAEQPINYTLTY